VLLFCVWRTVVVQLDVDGSAIMPRAGLGPVSCSPMQGHVGGTAVQWISRASTPDPLPAARDPA
jgi:hypothetical protein